MHAGAPVSAATFGPEPVGRARARRRLPFLRRDPAGTYALAGGGRLRWCGGCRAHVLERAEAQPCPRCAEPPVDDHDDEGREHVLAALADLMRTGGVDPGPRSAP